MDRPLTAKQDLLLLTSPHLSLNREGVVGAPQMIRKQFPPFLWVFSALWELGELKVCPFPDVVFQLLFLSALSSSPFHCALQYGFCQI